MLNAVYCSAWLDLLGLAVNTAATDVLYLDANDDDP